MTQIKHGQFTFALGWSGIIHRQRLRKFDPVADIEAW
ncbi:hypothetical protein SULPSESMR1_01216 [Pseudosulfitobacter pseudonitzschiae]|uniref:Uncharacterized protein n=1 Tax=Pseudosulfitobacter pseudonitzschiae TaxID=1402135 RepID=A0A221JZ73_9RHOB|nr:hypothetical protein SULPSESMR1_01216 [Pseudosulfitobacter pseudonitzschiae]